MRRLVVALLAVGCLVGTGQPAQARAVPVKRGTMVAVDDGGRVSFDFTVVVSTAAEVGEGQVDLVVPMHGRLGPTTYRRTSGGPVVRLRGSFPSELAYRGRQSWRLVDRRDGRVTVVPVVVRRTGGR
jgi:hypothetical protein